MKVSIIGYGGMGESVLKDLRGIDGLEEIVVLDPDPKRLETARGHGARTVTDQRAIFEDPAVRLVYVASSNHTHKEITLAALQAGKAVLCEKPMATSLADAREMVEASERPGAWLQIGFEMRYSRLYARVKEWIDAGLLGQVVNTAFTFICTEFHGKGAWRTKRASGGGMFGEKLSHYADLARWWTGSPVMDVTSFCSPNVVPYFEVRDNYHTTYRFANGAVGHLSFLMYLAQHSDVDPALTQPWEGRTAGGEELRFAIAGTRGGAQTDAFRRFAKRWEFGDSPTRMTSRLVERIGWQPEEDRTYWHNGTGQVHDVVRRIREGLPPATSARDSLETMKVVFAAEKSADCGETIRLDTL